MIQVAVSCTIVLMRKRTPESYTNSLSNESTEVHNPRRDCVILTLAHETHQTDVMPSELSSMSCIRGVANTPTELELAS